MKFNILIFIFISVASAYSKEDAVQAANLLGLPSEAIYIRSNIDTSFSCVGRNGYYADFANDCQIYHVCLPRLENSETVLHHFSFICPNSTIFSQKTLTCVGSNDYSCVSEYGSEEVNESADSKYVRKSFETSAKGSFVKSTKTQQDSVKFTYPTKKFTQFQEEIKKAPVKQVQEIKKYPFQEKVKKSQFKQVQFQEEIKHP